MSLTIRYGFGLMRVMWLPLWTSEKPLNGAKRCHENKENEHRLSGTIILCLKVYLYIMYLCCALGWDF